MTRAELERQLEELHPASFTWALGCCHRSHDEAEEVLQTVYLKIFEGKARFDGRSTLKTWLFAVIRKTAATHGRLRWLRATRFLPDRDLRAADPGESAERRLLGSERTAALVRALEKLARRQREVLELVFYHEMTIEEAGQTLGISLGAARQHYQRGKQRLLTLLGRP
jgi:RNA polymerase sigma-70 factor (ECF subfamily)